MKIIIRSIFIAAILFLSTTRSGAQCTVSEIFVQNVTIISSTATTCTAKFDVTFNIQDNNGNKFIFVHVWMDADYPNYFQCENGQTTLNGSIRAPVAADLGNSFFNLGLDNRGSLPVVLTSYPPDPSVPMAVMDSSTKVVLPDGSANITLHGVIATVPVPCSTPIVIVADVWSSQSATAQRAHCVNCGKHFAAGYLIVNGLVNCLNLTYNGTITNITPISITGYYRVFADVNGDGHFTPTTDTLLQNNTLFTVGPNASINISGTIPGVNLNQDIFIVVTQTTGNASGASTVYIFRSTQCAPLPVTFRSFTATRTSPNDVMIRWETATEINNRGFVVLRNTTNNTWESRTLISSLAQGGNSSELIRYSFSDINSSKGISQYRIQQIDLDGKVKLSEIRAVRGETQNTGIIVYPNPSENGRVNIVFDEKTSTRDISLVDGNGKQLKQWQGISGNTLQIENLRTGMYTLVVTSRETGNRTVEKIVVLNY